MKKKVNVKVDILKHKWLQGLLRQGQGNSVEEYEVYQFSGKELMLYAAEAAGVIGLIAYIFYHSLLACVILSPFAWFFIKSKQEDLKKKRLGELNVQFKDGISALSAALNTGYSIENAFKEACKDLNMIYGPQSLIGKEFQYIVHQVEMNVPVEPLLEDFARRSGLEDIKSFAEVFAAAKRSGGDLMQIIQASVRTISDKVEVKREIATLMSAKKMEQKIMNMVPFVIILYVNLTSPGFLNVMYGNLVGVIVMTGCLLVYALAFFMARKIMDIEV